ncbi:LacI family DNA-binding transcriptional regulator [Bifidobacterium simiarum]|uniref:LacI family transcriptional regulator n=1 Tax=Bifidobacterium simiarum TaxID=2045441 RepID=A0A2M9HGY1_9BIFI|nr:LacI family DNA-binding transcriptional regulator [Bifidobacterium simiarum]MBT1165845.1 LacI family DNA-binding transcriptional regulator [Bifidobacterium simiarum]PJM76043.1 LacI family transcriptional regulator [Bifidobacterium simiarum]
MNGKPTIKDVAAKAGVSVSAVSKVLRDAYGVSDEMRDKVNAAVKELDYRPRTAARSMRGRSYSIGVVMPGIASSFPTQIAEEINDFFKPTPYQPIITVGSGMAKEQIEAAEALIDRQIDGIILISPWMDIAWVERLATRIPTVLVARNGIGRHYDSVTDNAFEGALAMVSHLVELGHRSIAYTSMGDGGLKRPYVLSHTSRQDGYEYAMKMHGLKPRTVISAYTEDGGYRAGCELLDGDEPPTAIFAGSDIAAFGVMRAAYERGLRIPEDLTVTGYDNVFASGLHGVDLTTVDQSSNRMGRTAAQLLLERIEGRTEVVCRIESPKLVVRGSSAPPAKRR